MQIALFFVFADLPEERPKRHGDQKRTDGNGNADDKTANISPQKQLTKRAAECDKSDAGRKHKNESAPQIVAEGNRSQAEKIIEQVKGKNGDQAGEGDSFPAMLIHFVLQPVPAFFRNFGSNGILKQIARQKEGQTGTDCRAGNGKDYTPDWPPKEPRCKGEWDAGQKQGRRNGIDSQKNEWRRDGGVGQ